MLLGKVFRLLKDIVDVCWLRSIIFNFANLPIRQAIHIPILLYHPRFGLRSYLPALSGGGIVVLDVSNVKFGMIKLGKKSQMTCTQKGIWISNKGKLVFKGSTLIGNGCKIEIKKGAILEIGKNTGITGDTTINCHDHIVFGDFFSCAWNVSICDTDFHECYHICNSNVNLNPVTKPIKIGKFVWICQNVTILKGTVISDWCTVGAGSLIKGDYGHLLNNSLLVGVPTKIANVKIKRKDLSCIANLDSFYITKNIRTFG